MVNLIFASGKRKIKIEINQPVNVISLLELLSRRTCNPKLSFVLVRGKRLLSEDDIVYPSDTIIVYEVGSTG